MPLSIRSHLPMVLLVVLLLASCVTVQARGAFGMIPYEGYSEAAMHVTGSISGVEVDYNGTIQEVMDQFTRDNPGVAVEVNRNITRPTNLESRAKVSRQ